MADPAIQLTECVYRYDDRVSALQGITCSIAQGTWAALVGRNGSGKTTMAKLCNGLLRPQAGTVRILGRDAKRQSVGELARQVGYLFQNPDHQIFASTVREEIAFGLNNLGLPLDHVEGRLQEALSMFDLEAWADHPPAALGYGLRRQVTVASLFALRPPILILDEPTTGLDWGCTKRLLEHLRTLHQCGHTIVVITHDMRLVADWAERVLVLHDGRLIADETPRGLFARADLLPRTSLSAPPITELSRQLRPLGLRGDSPTVDAFWEEYTALHRGKPGGGS